MHLDPSIMKPFTKLTWLLAVAAQSCAQLQYTSTASSAVAQAAATALTQSPTSQVAGKTFDRFVQIWLENTDYSLAVGNGECISGGNAQAKFKCSRDVYYYYYYASVILVSGSVAWPTC